MDGLLLLTAGGKARGFGAEDRRGDLVRERFVQAAGHEHGRQGVGVDGADVIAAAFRDGVDQQALGGGDVASGADRLGIDAAFFTATQALAVIAVDATTTTTTDQADDDAGDEDAGADRRRRCQQGVIAQLDIEGEGTGAGGYR